MAGQQALVLMMAGGTGGHVYPALAVAREMLERGYRVEWVGTARGLEHRVVPAAGITLHCLSVRGVRGKSILHKLLGVLLLVLASLQALWLVFWRAPSCVVGMGGYVAGPAGVAAWLLRKPLLIHEQNAVAGTTNRMLAPLASKIVAGFPGAFREDLDYQVLGKPIRRELVKASSEIRPKRRQPKPTPQRVAELCATGAKDQPPIAVVLPSIVDQFAQLQQQFVARYGKEFEDQSPFKQATALVSEAHSALTAASKSYANSLSHEALNASERGLKKMEETLALFAGQISEGEEEGVEFEESDQYEMSDEYGEGEMESMPMESGEGRMNFENRSLPEPQFSAEEILQEESQNSESRKQAGSRGDSSVKKDW